MWTVQAVEALRSWSPNAAIQRNHPLFWDYRKLRPTEPEIVTASTPDHWLAFRDRGLQGGAGCHVQTASAMTVSKARRWSPLRESRSARSSGIGTAHTPANSGSARIATSRAELGNIDLCGHPSYYGGGKVLPARPSPPSTAGLGDVCRSATWRDYNPGIHPRRGRDALEFSNGQIGDLCVHLFDVTRIFLDLRWPRISSTGGIFMRDPPRE